MRVSVVSASFVLILVVVIAFGNMLQGAAGNDHKHVRRELINAITGFISIDCGLPKDSPGYTDPVTSIVYASDVGFAETGESKNISTEFRAGAQPAYLENVRSFPEGKRNCYTLQPEQGKNNSYLIRATFMYGNYDAKNQLPEFDLYLGPNPWITLSFNNSMDPIVEGIIYTPPTDYIHVCLVNTNKGVPFISALELRLLNNSIYKTASGSSLQSWKRYDYGRNLTDPPVRYKDDVYDRLWVSVATTGLKTVETQLTIDSMSNNEYKTPPVVMRTAVTPMDTNGSMYFSWEPADTTSGYYVYMHFAEVDHSTAGSGSSREFTIDRNGKPWVGPYTLPDNHQPLTVFTTEAQKQVELNFQIRPTNRSTLPPLLNAVEIYSEKSLQILPTEQEDVEAMINIKKWYNIASNWQGDPCLPNEHLWDGLKCNDDHLPMIISLNLTRRGLTGEIVLALSKLRSLQSLDLSYNNLTGTIPEFLADMRSLKALDITGNNLTGSLPQALLSRNGSSLTLSVGENPYLCVSVACEMKKKKKKSRKIELIVAASVISILVVVLLVVAFVFWKCKKKRSQEMAVESTNQVLLKSKYQPFTYSEIVSITNNFERVLGKGASGSVYHGYLKDHTQVAVKIINPTLMESSSQFQTEVQLLMTMHHKNLASLVGYCNESTNMALIYEYMAMGSLKEHLSEKNANVLTWKERLQIALDAAQGLEYLHNGCKPPIVHRDLKPANILLNENLRAKISDFGMSRIFETESNTHISTDNIAGTHGYVDPEYYTTYRLSEKSDVYSFGIVLLELITGQPAIMKDTHIVKWVEPLLENGDIQKIVYSRLEGRFGINSAWRAIETAMACVPSIAIQRQDMTFVQNELKECLAMELAYERQNSYETGTTSSLLKNASVDPQIEMAPHAR